MDSDPLDGKKRRAHASRWLTVVDDEDLRVSIEFYRGVAGMHCVFRSRVRSMRRARAIWPQIRAWLARMGHRVVYVFVPVADAKLRRFVRLFGFAGEQVRAGHYVMRQEV